MKKKAIKTFNWKKLVIVLSMLILVMTATSFNFSIISFVIGGVYALLFNLYTNEKWWFGI